MAFVEIIELSKAYGVEGVDRRTVLKGVNLEVPEGEFVVITGFSGSGKSTLVSLLAGDTTPDDGFVLLQGRAVSPHDKRVDRLQSAFPDFEWSTIFDALQQTAGKNDFQGDLPLILDAAGLLGREMEIIGTLDGLTRLRLSLVMSITRSPDVFILDEPFENVDRSWKPILQHQFAHLLRATGKTIVMMTNDLDEGILMADRIFPLTRGPQATLGPGFFVPFPRPRTLSSISGMPEFQMLRRQIMDFLMGQAHVSDTDLSSHPVRGQSFDWSHNHRSQSWR